MTNIKEGLKDFLNQLLVKQGFNNITSIQHTMYLLDEDKCIASQRMSAVVKFDDNSKDVELFLKVTPKNHKTVSFLNDELSLTEKETLFYAKILPALTDFEKEFRKHYQEELSVQSFFFKYFGSGFVNQDFFIVLKKFSSEDYFVTNQLDFHNSEQVKSVLQPMAIFHATSYAMKYLMHKDILQEYPILIDKVYHPSKFEIFGPFFIDKFKAHIKVLKAVFKEMRNDSYPDAKLYLSDICLKESILVRLENLSDQIMTVLHHIQECDNRYKVISHGDCHLFNIAFPTDGKYLPLQFFDFQAIRFSSCLIDVQHYLSQVTTPDTRKKMLTEFLGYYLEKFNEVCCSYDLSKDKQMSYDEVEMEYKRTNPWQFLYAFAWILPRFVDDDFYTQLSATESDSQVMDLLFKQKGGAMTLKMIQTYFEIVKEADEEGTLDQMDTLCKMSE